MISISKKQQLLYKIVKTNKISSIAKVIEEGALVNDPVSSNGMTALHHAASKGNSDGVTILIDNGADVNLLDNTDRTALHFAAADGTSVEAVETLINAGADINAKTTGGDTPLMKAAIFNQAEVVEVLMDKGASVGEQNNCGKTAFDIAESNNSETISKLLSG